MKIEITIDSYIRCYLPKFRRIKVRKEKDQFHFQWLFFFVFIKRFTYFNFGDDHWREADNGDL